MKAPQSAINQIRCHCILALILAGYGCQQDSPSQTPVEPQPALVANVSKSRSSVSNKSDLDAFAAIPPRFVTVTPEIGIDFTFDSDLVPDRFFLPEIMGSGVAWIDIDGDGWMDLFAPNGRHLEDISTSTDQPVSRLWRNQAGKQFTEITGQSGMGLEMFGQGCAVADYDGDGFADIYVSGYGPDRLLHNHGDGTFSDASDESGISRADWTVGAIWIDLDGDHQLDLYCVNYLNVTLANNRICRLGGSPAYCGPGNFDAVQDQCFVNLADGTFLESTERLGFRADKGNGMSVAAVDLNDDLIPEIYVANDMTANFLFERQTHPVLPDRPLYREIAVQSGCAVAGSGASEASMGIAIADFDSDGRSDIYLTHYYHMKNTLYQNLGHLMFDDVSHGSNATATSYESLGFGTVPFDYDRDGDPDLFVANGHVLGPKQQPGAMPPQILNNHKGRFRDISSQAGTYFNELWLGRGVAACDYDNDGDIDLAISHVGRPFVLLRNDTPVDDSPYIGLKLSTAFRSLPVGGRVIVHLDQRKITYPVVTGASYMAAPDSRLLLSWPRTEPLQEIEIFWPSGRIDHLKNLETHRYWEIVEGRDPL